MVIQSRKIVSAIICYFAFMELLLPQSRWPEANCASCFQNNTCLYINSPHTLQKKKEKKKKKKPTGTKQKQAMKKVF